MANETPIEPTEILPAGEPLTVDDEQRPATEPGQSVARRSGRLPLLATSVTVGPLAAATVTAAAAITTVRAVAALHRMVRGGWGTGGLSAPGSGPGWTSGSVLAPGLRVTWTYIEVSWSNPRP